MLRCIELLTLKKQIVTIYIIMIIIMIILFINITAFSTINI